MDVQFLLFGLPTPYSDMPEIDVCVLEAPRTGDGLLMFFNDQPLTGLHIDTDFCMSIIETFI